MNRKDISQWETLEPYLAEPIDTIVHLAAIAGVRESFTEARKYFHNNIQGHFTLLEFAQRLKGLKQFIYASSSSVYGNSVRQSVDAPVESQESFYALSKRIDEIFSEFYARHHHVAATGLRFFTSYGPWGRPDMTPFLFIDAIVGDKALSLFNHGNLSRDFIYIDDLIQGILAVIDQPASGGHRLYNLGRGKGESVSRMIEILERLFDKKAHIVPMPMQRGDVKETMADLSGQDLVFTPRIPLEIGLARCVEWYRDYYRV